MSVDLNIISAIHNFVSYSSPNHYDILITISHHPIVNMGGIHSAMWFICIHMSLLSFYGIQYNYTMAYNIMKWCVDVSVCRSFGVSAFCFVDVLFCRRFVLSTFCFVDVSVCRRFGLSTFWFVDVLVCRRFGLSTFRCVDDLVFDVSVCRRFNQLPPQ